MKAAKIKRRVQERLRVGFAFRTLAEQALTILVWALPARVIETWVRRKISRRVYECIPSEVYLFKSGRSALHGLMRALRTESPDRRLAYIPDYVCNVVGAACRDAGFSIVEYPTDPQCLPEWKSLENLLKNDPAPVLVLCSLFGSVPVLNNKVAALTKATPRLFIVADECQNLAPNSPVKIGQNMAVVFSFNDKTCPGIMGGGCVCQTGSLAIPLYRRGTMCRRVLCSAAIFRLWIRKSAEQVGHMVQLACKRNGTYKVPGRLEYSTCSSAHYDLVPESIYKLSAARALISLLFLDSYRQARIENERAIRTGLSSQRVGFESVAVRSGPAFLPVFPGADPLPIDFPAPVKGAYGVSPVKSAASRVPILLKINSPFVRYEVLELSVVQLTSRHTITDNRILHCMARTADSAGYKSVVMGPAISDSAFEKIRLQACPIVSPGYRCPFFLTWFSLFKGALKYRSVLFQFHDLDLLPVALLLKIIGRKVVYDIHDDYEASFKVRLAKSWLLGSWFPAFWGWTERVVARVFDGVVVADRHLEEEFASCRPVVLGNFPRLTFTSVAETSVEETFNLIYVGGVTRERGLEMALKAIQLLSMPELRLHVIGTGRETDLMEQLRAEPRIVLHGRVPWTDLYRHYEHAHVGLALYQPLECFQYCPGENAVKVIEYMAAGIPIICSNFPGLKVFVEDSGCGIVVQPDDPKKIAEKINQLFKDAELRRRLGDKGRQLFESEYHWEKHEQKLVDLYRRILGE